MITKAKMIAMCHILERDGYTNVAAIVSRIWHAYDIAVPSTAADELEAESIARPPPPPTWDMITREQERYESLRSEFREVSESRDFYRAQLEATTAERDTVIAAYNSLCDTLVQLGERLQPFVAPKGRIDLPPSAFAPPS